MSLSRADVPRAKFTSISDVLSDRLAASRFLVPIVTCPPFDVSDRKQSRCLTPASIPAAMHVDVTKSLAQITKIRELMGHFLICTIVNLCLYTVVVQFRKNLVYDLDSSILMSACLLLVLLVTSVSVVLKRGPGCLEFYGLICSEWPTRVRHAVTYSLPILALIVLAKWIAIRFLPDFGHLDLFSGRLSQRPLQSNYLVQLAIYVVLIPVQEFIARGILQGSLQEFLTGRTRVLKAILISNLLFSTFHLFVSPYFALLSFFPGMFWGWLYSRQRSLIAVTVSHTLIGVWALYLVGTPGIAIRP
ncbi:MAG TPA: CPBP family intramembrane glutamic endopeptidase [Chthoniobacterales bacterium]|nr:CPBP family intramembrane glutamic endopeptidase [Chthoniobacterales bacterium]